MTGHLKILLCLMCVPLCLAASLDGLSDCSSVPRVTAGAPQTCVASDEGNVRYHLAQHTTQICNGEEWQSLATQTSSAPKSCLEILQEGKSHGDGFYFLSLSNGTRYRAYCDMTTEGGGWTLFATMVTPSFPFISFTSNRDSAQATDYDSAGCAPVGTSSVLFRFRQEPITSLVVYSLNNGASSFGKTALNSRLLCGVHPLTGGTVDVDGFYKKTLFEANGERVPNTGFHTIIQLYQENFGFAEDHGRSDKWLSLWSGLDTRGDNYHSSDNPNGLGTKCIAGLCRLNEPVWLMYR